MVQVRISNMYDMSTTIGKLGVLGIHTPSRESIYRKYGGLFQNFTYQKVVSCDVRIACASMLPADPLQIGVESGKISPADMMNPILYRAVSNDSWNTVINRIYSTNEGTNGDTVRGIPNGFSQLTDAQMENIYYALLSDDGWKKALPQQGLTMTGLRPLVYSVVNTFGNISASAVGQLDGSNKVASLDTVMTTTPAGVSFNQQNLAATIRGPAMPMPRIPCIPSEQSAYNSCPKTFVACIVLPPAQLNVLYYRLIVSWTIEFTEIRPKTDYGTVAEITAIGNAAHVSTWSISNSKDLEPIAEDDVVKNIGFVDSLNMDPELVMEK